MIACRALRSPLGLEVLKVGEQVFTAVDTQSLERAAAEVMDEDIQREKKLKSRLARPDARIKAGMYATVTRIGQWQP